MAGQAVTTLMVYAGPAAADAPVTRTGGVPLVPAGFGWPQCRACEGPMTFLAQVMPSDLPPDCGQSVLSVFMCQNDPGMCEDWDPWSGGNRALQFPLAGLRPAGVPDGPAMLGEVSAVERVTMEEDYGRARRAWADRAGRPASDQLGQLGGRPWWLQHDETPACPQCGAGMSFAVQLAEGRHHRSSANFGTGYGYGFTCGSCSTAAFLWQR